METLPKYCYARGQRIWARVKDEDGKWVNRRTEYTTMTSAQIDAAGRQAWAWMQGAAARKALLVDESFPKCRTLRAYIAYWLREREERGISSVVDDRCRLEKYVIPRIGDLDVESVTPQHARTLVRELVKLRKSGEIAPRTVIHIFRAIHNVYESAVIEQIVSENPIIVKAGELPKKGIDADPEWRMLATFETLEVERLLTNTIIPHARRVLYALKSLAGLRHGEAAALCWRHWDMTMQPLGRIRVVQSYCSRYDRVKETKTEEVRAVPVHPALARILADWRLAWAKAYGREPTAEDFIVPANDFTPIPVRAAVRAMADDLAALGLRVEAGSLRNRGGHDLRAWFKTQSIEDGAIGDIIRRVTHAAPKDVEGGYERFSWSAMCREVSKLKVDLDTTPIATPPVAPPSPPVRFATRPMTVAFASALERAARRADMPRVLKIASELREYRSALP